MYASMKRSTALAVVALIPALINCAPTASISSVASAPAASGSSVPKNAVDVLNAALGTTTTAKTINTNTSLGLGLGTKDLVGSTGEWTTKLCTDPGVTDASMLPQTRWDDLDTDAAWQATLAYVKNPPNGNADNIDFTEMVSNFFHGPQRNQCSKLGSNGCSSYAECTDVDHPAGMLILNSFVATNGIYNNFYQGVTNAEGSVTPNIGTFSSTFAPIDDPDAGLKIALDILGLGFALVASPFWNSIFKALPFFKANPNTLGTIKDEVNPLVSNGLTIIKDAGLSGQILNVQNKIGTNLDNLVTIWADAIDRSNKQLFDGSDIDALTKQIAHGLMLDSAVSVDKDDVKQSALKAIYGYLIPQAWALSNEHISPVIIDTGVKCGTTYPEKDYIENTIADATMTCINGNMYYLVGADGAEITCTGGYMSSNICTPGKFNELPGTSSLSHWGGLTHDDLAIGAVNTYKANGNKNGGAMIDVTQQSALDDIFNNGVQAAGIVIIPVCGAKEAMQNWRQYNKKAKFYPCN